jgi:molybdopterin/thiamine biosynthesis adenylyltransferase
MLTPYDQERYDRQIRIRGFGGDGQEKLKRTKVFVAGVGGLGCMVAMHLVAAGVGRIRIVDHGIVELSNLNRQILYWDDDVGKDKVDSAAEKLKQLNQQVEVEMVRETIDESSISQLVSSFDLIIDALDNLSTRYLLNKVALQSNIPLFHGAVQGLEGRAMTVIPGQTACLRCVYHRKLPQAKLPVLGTTPAIIGAIQATEVIKYIVGIGQLLTNRLLVYDGLSMKFTEFRVKPDPDCEHCGKLAGGRS